jgi:hypothetical protein
MLPPRSLVTAPDTQKFALRKVRFPLIVRPLLAAFSLLVSSLSATESDVTAIAAPGPRETREIDGIVFEFSPQHEALITALAPQLVAFNAEPIAAPAIEPAANDPETNPAATFTPAHFVASRDGYLTGIARLSGLPTPTTLQQECYDTILDLAAKLQSSMKTAAGSFAQEIPVKRVLVWDRPDLLGRLQAGEGIPGFTLSADGKSGQFDWGLNLPAAPTTDADAATGAKKVYGHLIYKSVNNRIVLSGEMTATPASAPATNAPEPQEARKASTIYVIVLGDKHSSLSHEERVAKVFKENIRGAREAVLNYSRQIGAIQLDGGGFAFFLLKETSRLDLSERLGSRPELRWLSEGAARYITWRTLHERHTPETALAAYDLRANLSQSAERRPHVDFATWKSPGEQPSPEAEGLDEAHKTYAAMMFFVMAQRYGDDSIPRFFAELTKTPPQKMSARVVEKAFRKITGADLNKLLNEVVPPAPKRKSAR